MASSSRYRTAFTLVELLVVIGIIALLIALLMPSLGLAQQQAQRISCAAKLHQIMIAAQIHANDHKGFFPPAGVLPGWKPADLDDAYSGKYSYMTDRTDTMGFFTPYIAPITISLASEMSYRRVLDIDNPTSLGAAETDDRGFIRQFLCPSQASSISELPQLPMLYASSSTVVQGGSTWSLSMLYFEQQSYNFNEAVLGFGDQYTSNRLKGQLSQIRKSAQTMFAADGLMGSIYESRYPWSQGMGMATFYNISNDPGVTMGDALSSNGLAGDIENFDMRRHRGKINIAFCDGHVETRTISVNDLKSVYLLAP